MTYIDGKTRQKVGKIESEKRTRGRAEKVDEVTREKPPQSHYNAKRMAKLNENRIIYISRGKCAENAPKEN